MNRIIKTQLHLNGWVAVLIGSFIILDPVNLLAPYGLQAELSAGLLSELRAPGGLLLASGLVIVFCASRPSTARNGLLLSIMVYGGYGSVRLLAILLDGPPAAEIQLAMAIEAGLCLLSAMSLYKVQFRDGSAFSGQERYL